LFAPAGLTGTYTKDYPGIITSKSQSGEKKARNPGRTADAAKLGSENNHLHAKFFIDSKL
jgi:hypothetical protein